MTSANRGAAETGVGPQSGRADARRNYAAVIEAGRAAFAEHGVDASMDDIARAAGVGKGTLYRHFATKDHLIAAVLTEHFQRLTAEAASLVDADDPASAVGTWLAEFDRGPLSPGLRGRLRALLNDPDATVQQACGPMRDQFAVLLERAQRAGAVRPELDAPAVLDLVASLPPRDRAADGSSPYLPVILRGITQGRG
jgi:AcrR family transcriptional regulator